MNTTDVYGVATVTMSSAAMSPVYGERWNGDNSAVYMLGASNNLVFRCGQIIDAIGTPELPVIGGLGGTENSAYVSNLQRAT